MRDYGPLLLAAVLGAFLWFLAQPSPPACPDGKCPSPAPPPSPVKPKKRPWGEDCEAPVGAVVANYGLGCPCCFGGKCDCGGKCRCPK